MQVIVFLAKNVFVRVLFLLLDGMPVPVHHSILPVSTSTSAGIEVLCEQSVLRKSITLGREFPRRLCDPLPQYDFCVSGRSALVITNWGKLNLGTKVESAVDYIQR